MNRVALTAAIRDHEPLDLVEDGHRLRMLAVLEAAAAPDAPFDPWDRTHFTPGHFTASAVVLSPDGTSMLMIFHRKLKRWLQPGGHIEPQDPDTHEAARREAIEETGLDALADASPSLIDLDVHAIPAHAGMPRHQHLDVRHAFRAGHSDLSAGSEVKEARWVPLTELTGPDQDPSIRRIAQKLSTLDPRRSQSQP